MQSIMAKIFRRQVSTSLHIVVSRVQRIKGICGDDAESKGTFVWGKVHVGKRDVTYAGTGSTGGAGTLGGR